MRLAFVVFSILGASVGIWGAAESAADVGLWDRWEASFSAKADPDTQVRVVFTAPDGRTRTRDAFWDGGETWRVRFQPDATGRWSYATESRPPVAGLDGQRGAFTCGPSTRATPFLKHGPIRVAKVGTHFEHADGTPFFWLVDTVWNGALKSTSEDWDRYLDDRVRNGFTGVQFVATQWRTAYTSLEGHTAYDGYERIRIHPEFFRRIDARIDAVGAKGLLAVPVMLWTLGRKEHNPGQLPESEAIRLARYLVARYGAHHVAWFLPGDGNYSGANAERWKRIGRAVFGEGRDHAPVFLHPQGMQWPYDAFLEERWLSAFGYQSGHGDDGDTLRWIYAGPPAEKWSAEPRRPVINLEPPYEDHVAYQSRQRHTAYTVRRALYWSLLNAPTAGTSYGAHGVWSWETEPAEPQEHGGTGVARPWFEAIRLPGSESVRHLSGLFRSLPWWELRPAPGLAEPAGEEGPGDPGPAHIVYTRERDGRAILYVDGERKAARPIEGDLSPWDRSFRLALANELTRDRSWLGTFGRVAIYDRALAPSEVERSYRGGAKGPPAEGALALYTFDEREGDTVRDRAKGPAPLDLRIADPSAVEWIAGGGLAVRKPTLIATPGPASRLAAAMVASGACTLDVWIVPANRTQAGPARIVTLSADTARRNFTLGQKGAGYEVRLRTDKTSANGEPALETGAGPGGDPAARHVAASRSADGTLAVVYVPVGGSIRVRIDRLAPGRTFEWFDPRTGRRSSARPGEGGTFETPGGEDWVLLAR